MQSNALTVQQYLASMPADRRETIEAIRAVILKNLPQGYQEGMQYGMIGYFVPHGVYPAGYHCDPKQPLPFIGLASQKNHMALYMFCLYLDDDQAQSFRDSWLATGKKIDMGKSCIRFKKLGDVPLEVIGKAVRVPAKKFVESYEKRLQRASGGASEKTQTVSAASKKAATKKVTSKKVASKQTASKKPVSKKRVSKKTASKKAAAKSSGVRTTAKG
jgi:hypothetical protein